MRTRRIAFAVWNVVLVVALAVTGVMAASAPQHVQAAGDSDKETADLVITKELEWSSCRPGDTIHYYLVYSNAGPVAATDVVITDAVPAHLLDPSWTAYGEPDVAVVRGTTYQWSLSTLARGESGGIIVTGTIDPDWDWSQEITVLNTATIASATLDSDPSNNSAVAAFDVWLSEEVPYAFFRADVTSGYEPLSVGFEASTYYGNPPVTFLWSFGDGQTSTLQSPSHQYAQDGAYTVTLTVTDADGDSCTETKTDYITVSDTVPAADFSAAPTSGSEPLTVAFTDQSTSYDGIVSWSWGFGDGQTSTEQNPSHTYSDSGTYVATLTVQEGDGGTSAATVTITVNPVNDAPVAVDDSYSTNEDTPLTVVAPGVLGNDTDADGDPLTAILLSDTSNGTLILNADGSFTYTPSANYNGPDGFTYIANDGTADSNVATVSITVNPVNDAPVANDDSIFTDMETPVTINVLANDTDGDGNLDPESTELTDFPEGFFENLGGGLILYRPSPGYVGFDSFTYRIWDTDGLSDTAIVTIGVGTTGNQPVANSDSVITEIDTPVIIDVAANDTDGDGNLDPSTAIATTLPGHGTLTNNGDGTFNYTPESGYHGLDSFYYQISDTDGNSATAMVTIQVGSPNHPPVANTDYVLIIDASDFVIIDVAANDTDEDGNLDPASAIVVEPPGHGLLTNNPDGTFNYYPAYLGPDYFIYKIYDDAGASAWAVVYISVGDPASNHPPVANDDTVMTPMGTSVDFDVTVNDTDEDGNLVWQQIFIVVEPEFGSVEGSANYNGYLTYTPSPDFSGFDTFTYEIRDVWGLSDTAVVTIQVGTGNYRPVADYQAVSVDEDSSVVITLTASDVDGDPLSYHVVKPPDNGTLSGSGAVLTYTPMANYHGADVLTFQVNDGELDSSIAIVTITVNAVNDAPVAQACDCRMDEDTILTVGAPGVLAYVTEFDGDPLTAIKVSEPLHGTLTLNADGSFTYTPNADFNGTDSFTYMVNDGETDSNVATVTIIIVPVNDAPVANDDRVTTNVGTPVTIDVAANDTDADGNLDVATAWAILGPSHGTVEYYGDGLLRYTPNGDDVDSDTFTYSISDYDGLSDTAEVTITVNPVNDAPEADDQAVSTDEDTAVGITLTGSDVDGDTLTFSVVDGPAHGTLTGSGADLTYTPDANFNGADSFTFTTNDGELDSSLATVSITVNPVNDEPTVANPIPDQMATEDVAFACTLPLDTFNDVDAGDSLTYAATQVGGLPLPSWLVFDAATATFYGSPDYNSAGEILVEVTATDQSGASVSDTFRITVINTNRAPEVQDPPGVQTNSEGDIVYLQIQASDPDGDDIIFTATAPPPGLTFDAATGVISGTLGYDSAGVYSMAVTVSDTDPTDPRSTSIIILWIVNNTNRPPQITSPVDQISAEGETVFLAITASDPDGDALTFAATGLPTDLTIDAATGVITGTLGYASPGSYTVTVTVSDGEDYTSVTFSWTVSNTNREPVADNQAVTTDEDAAIAITLTGSDVDGDALTYSVVDGPTHGSLSGVAPNLTYTPEMNYNGTDSLTFRTNDGELDSSLATVTITVTAVADVNTFTFVFSSANPSVYGQRVTLVALVLPDTWDSGMPTGTVTFMDGGVVLGTGTLNAWGLATCTTTSLSVGSHSITVVYSGPADFNGSSSPVLTQKVNKAKTSVRVTSSANPSVSGQSVTFTATVVATEPGSGTPTGKVTFKDGSRILGTGTLDASGQATYTTSSLSVGNHSITAVYGGDGNYSGSTSSALSQKVKRT
jgi:VCBS repeat-containing protein